MNPLCFVLMPFGIKKDDNNNEIDFNKIYNNFIKPSIIDAKLEPIRADEEQVGGIIHKAMYERLMLCDYAVADLSISNANIFYELGIRHSFQPHCTISIFEEKSILSFDISFLRSLPYDRELKELDKLKQQLTQKLLLAQKEKNTDSPLFQLVDGIKPSNIEHIKTDVFRNQVEYNQKIKERLLLARKHKDIQSLIDIENEINFDSVEIGVLVDLFLSYRGIESFSNMISLVNKMPEVLSRTTMIQEQYGFALNRENQKEDAIDVLEAVILKNGNNSETCGILARVYKDKWNEALAKGDTFNAKGYLTKAIKTYVNGFESDFRDAYPGVNAVTLMDIANDPRKDELIPIVKYAVKQKMKNSSDYWDYATLLELHILDNNEEAANGILFEVIENIREPFEPKTTANNIKMIRMNKESKELNCDWIKGIEEKLLRNN
ncbi:MAG: DUF4071 domain-containing protein [Campylobacteraceae bacterium]|nr:DUF4071 domain-containing protein [Campylobacteraceae bacterium]